MFSFRSAFQYLLEGSPKYLSFAFSAAHNRTDAARDMLQDHLIQLL
ncbi:MAG: hypothetical protein ACOYM2_11015 [Rectinemataceae bacterium]